jgi:hypothetical protein
MDWVLQVVRVSAESDSAHFSLRATFNHRSSHNRCEKRFDFRVNWRSICYKCNESRSGARSKIVSEIFEYKQIVEKVETASLLQKTQFVIYRAFDPPLFPRPHLFNIRLGWCDTNDSRTKVGKRSSKALQVANHPTIVHGKYTRSRHSCLVCTSSHYWQSSMRSSARVSGQRKHF